MTIMRGRVNIAEASTLAFFFHRQWLHLVALALLVPICWAFAASSLGDGESGELGTDMVAAQKCLAGYTKAESFGKRGFTRFENPQPKRIG